MPILTRADQGRMPTTKMKVMTVATLPPAANHAGHVAYVSNGSAGNPCLAASDGTNWRIIAALGANVSAT